MLWRLILSEARGMTTPWGNLSASWQSPCPSWPGSWDGDMRVVEKTRTKKIKARPPCNSVTTSQY